MADKPQQPAQPQYQSQEPVAPTTPYEQQPVAQQYFAQPQAAPVQYVVQAQSVKGVGGWLLFFAIIAGLAALGYIGIFFASFAENKIVDTMFAPILFGLALASVTFIALEKKLAKILYPTFWAVSVIYSITTSIVAGTEAVTVASAAVTGFVIAGLVGLYFFKSKRVKETLIK